MKWKAKGKEGEYKLYLHSQMFLGGSQQKDERQQSCCNKGNSYQIKKLKTFTVKVIRH